MIIWEGQVSQCVSHNSEKMNRKLCGTDEFDCRWFNTEEKGSSRHHTKKLHELLRWALFANKNSNMHKERIKVRIKIK